MKNKYFLTFLCIITFPITACSGTLRVEPDPFDPNLHGQVVRFTVPMVYMELNDIDKNKFDQKALNTGKILLTADESNQLFNKNNNHRLINIKCNMTFIIIESYHVLHDWFTREFASDYQQLVLKDENGIISTSNRLTLLDSNKPELAK